MSTDPRIEAAAKVLAEVTGEPRVGRFENTMATAAVAAIDRVAESVLAKLVAVASEHDQGRGACVCELCFQLQEAGAL